MPTVTVTELEQARRCEYQWEFNSHNRMALESANPLRSLYLGTLWHQVLDSLAQKQLITKPHRFKGSNAEHCEECGYNLFSHTPDPFATHSGFLQQQVSDTYTSIMGFPPTYQEMKPTYDTINTCRAMLKGYLSYYDNNLLPADFEYLQPEQQIYKILPGTEHCKCYYQERCNCMLAPQLCELHYPDCRCNNTGCKCRQFHILEGKLDATIRHVPTGYLYILENKTFSIHPNVNELHRTHQFMGYRWIASSLDIAGMMYNGIWTRTEVPNGWNKEANRKWNIHDMYLRKIVSWQQAEIDEWGVQTAQTALRILAPNYITTRNVPAVGGCNGVNSCSYKSLCDARFAGQNYELVKAKEYRSRDVSGIAHDLYGTV